MHRQLCLLAILIPTAACLAHPGHGDEALASGSRSQPDAKVSIEIRDGYRWITSNGLPDHQAGQFPNRNNPNSIAPQEYKFRVALEPKTNDQPREARGALFGVALNGVVFDPGTAEWWRDDPSLGWHMEAIGGPRNLGLDQNNAHVQPSGAYHYHSIPVGLIKELSKDSSKEPVLVGWAADGFPIYGPMGYSDAKDIASKLTELHSSYRLKSGKRPGGSEGPGGKYDGAYTQDFEYVAGSGDLDECNGRFGITKEFPQGTYYYVITSEFPFIGRMFRGEPDASFMRRRPGPGGPGAGPGGRGARGRRAGPPPPRP